MNEINYLDKATSLINTYKLHYVIGALFIIVSAVTWHMDLTGMVPPCEYCQTQRTLIGILGLTLIIDSSLIHYLLSLYLVLFGIDVGLAQVFLHVQEKTLFATMFTYLAMTATYAFFLSGLVILARIQHHIKKTH